MPENPTSADQTIARIAELARQALQVQADLARASVEFGRATLSSEVDASSAGRAWVDAVGRESTRYWTEVGALGLDIAGQLVSIGSRSLARVMSDTRSATTPGGPRTSTTSAPRGAIPRQGHSGTQHSDTQHSDTQHSGTQHSGTQHSGTRHSGTQHDGADGPARSVDLTTEPADRHQKSTTAEDLEVTKVAEAATDGVKRGSVTLRGRAGETASGTVTLANQHSRARRVLLTASPLRPESGRDVSLELHLDQESVTIPAMTEQEVHLDVELREAVVRPGERYGCIVEVSGGVEAVLDVTAVVE